MDDVHYCAGIEKERQDRRVRLWTTVAVFVTALALRAGGEMPPFDDLYHLKRIEAFPLVLDPDPDRGAGGAYCPWPPLYDFVLGAVARFMGTEAIEWIPPLSYSAFAAFVTHRFGVTAGLTIALSPYLIGISRRAHIDHHWLESILVVAICSAVERQRLTKSVTDAGARVRAAASWTALLIVALFVQPALIVAAGLAFVASPGVTGGLSGARRRGAEAAPFAIAAFVVAVYRLTRPADYPGGPWFLGWPHAALLAAAATTLYLRSRTPGEPGVAGAPRARTYGTIGAGALAVALLLPALPDLVEGIRFFGRHPWLERIVEFQPMFRDGSRMGTDMANITGGAFLIVLVARRHPALAIFATGYLLLALTSRRFLVAAVPLVAIAASTAVAQLLPDRRKALAAMAITIAPPLVYDIYDRQQPPNEHPLPKAVATAVSPLPPGRVLAPWNLGHAIDVIGRHPVVIDNFGTMPDPLLFDRAIDALRQRHPDALRAWCKANGVRYLVLSRVAQASSPRSRMVWWRLLHGETIPHFVRRNEFVWEVR